LKFFDIALDLEPENDEAWFHKAKALDILGEKDEAKICLEKAVALNPNNNYTQKGKIKVESTGQEPSGT